jgi:hypothetical protein
MGINQKDKIIQLNNSYPLNHMFKNTRQSIIVFSSVTHQLVHREDYNINKNKKFPWL